MQIRSVFLADLERCYATTPLRIDGRMHYLFASELDAPCYAFDAQTLERQTVWEHPGGAMAMIPLADREGEFLAIQRFKPKMMAPDTEVVWVRRDRQGRWQTSTLARKGYIHRFDVLQGDKKYLLVCTIASHKACFEDWSCPGKLWAGELPDDLSQEVELKPICEGLTKNHGYCRARWNGRQAAMISGEAGVMLVTPPQRSGGDWSIETVLDRPVSDIAVVDIDGDGEVELASIEPFHGDRFVINKRIDGQWRQVYRYPGDFRVGHAIWGGSLRGKPAFIGGAREGAGELFVIRCAQTEPLQFSCEILDAGKGPANVQVVCGEEEDTLLVSNREVGQAWLYHIRD